LAAALAALAAAGAAFSIRTPYLVVRSPGGRVAARFALSLSDPSFSISYLHSVARLPCVETFRPGPAGSIELTRTAYKGLGAGLPFTEEGGRLSLQDGWIVIEGLSRRFPRIAVLPMSFTEHRLAIGRQVYALADLTGGHLAVLTIERLSFVRRLVLGNRMRYTKP
jgi:hypothetical protein